MPRLKIHNNTKKISIRPGRLGFFGVLLLCLLTLSLDAGAQQGPDSELRLIAQPGSRLWITGTTSVSEYACAANEIGGYAFVDRGTTQNLDSRRQGSAQVEVEVKVDQLDCGKRRMNHDMYNALKAKQHPNIRYELLNASIADSSVADSTEWYKINTLGVLEIAGVRDTLSMAVNGRLTDNNTFRIQGEKPLNMNTFNIKPPTALLGLIRADERLVVHFDLIVAPSSPTTSRQP